MGEGRGFVPPDARRHEVKPRDAGLSNEGRREMPTTSDPDLLRHLIELPLKRRRESIIDTLVVLAVTNPEGFVMLSRDIERIRREEAEAATRADQEYEQMRATQREQMEKEVRQRYEKQKQEALDAIEQSRVRAIARDAMLMSWMIMHGNNPQQTQISSILDDAGMQIPED